MTELKIKKVETEQELKQVFGIRKHVFIEEQNVPVEVEMDEFDETAEHFIAYIGETPIGCARIRTNGFVKLERIAITKENRNKGYGTQLTKYLIDISKKNDKEIMMHSQDYVKDFYKKFGFEIVGDSFYEGGIKHVKMVLKS